MGRVLGICAQLDLNTDVTHMARWVVNHFHDRVRLEVTDPNGRVIDAVAAAAAYMACCVLGEGRDLDVIAGCVEVGDAAIGCAYVLLHGCRHDLFDRQLLARRGIALGAIDEVLPPGLA